MKSFWDRVDKTGECWIWQGYIRPDGYGIASRGRVRGNALAHRHAWELTNGPVPADLGVCHTCDNPPCVRPAHLFLGTQADNLRDMVLKGRSNSRKIMGELNSGAKLTNAQALAIRADPRTERTLAIQYGVSHTTIGTIRRGLSYRGVGGMNDPAS